MSVFCVRNWSLCEKEVETCGFSWLDVCTVTKNTVNRDSFFISWFLLLLTISAHIDLKPKATIELDNATGDKERIR